MRRNGRRNTNRYWTGPLDANCRPAAIHDLIREPSGAKAAPSPDTNAPHELSSRLPAIPLLGSEEAFQLRPLPHPLPHPLAVQSSLLTSVAYDRDRAILQLEFGYGAVYQYFGVPVQSYQELLRQPPTAPISIATFEAYSATFCCPLYKKRPPL